MHEQIEFVALRGASGRVKDLINAVHCRLIVFICSDQLREHGRSKEKGGGRWSGGRSVLPRAYYARAPGVGLLGWSKRGGGVRGFVGLFTLTLALSHRGRGDGSPARGQPRPSIRPVTLTLALSHRGRGDDSSAGTTRPSIRPVTLTLALSHVGERGFLHRPAALGIPCGRIAARRGHIYLHFWVVY